IASGVAFALLIIGLRSLREGGADSAVLLGNALAAAVSAPLALRGAAPGAKDWAILAYLGCFQLALAYFCFNRGLRGVSALEGSLLALLEPILNPIWTFLVAGERPGPWAIGGGAVILAATTLRVFSSAPRRGEARLERPQT
ncbi:MAG TPA: DMT family transporter, partial [Planctomycetota bacterium]|nr:DMT family transporter [Planctomycetota bacterium]